ncbi:serine/threonine-protein kinase [Arthrospira platensis]|uniref:serine/threonine-protein kinase n=1 Tax=Limnospira TaxID=2596745 RepID=UPI0001C38834|nr:serine/threonine-protein kinase [Arthrospira platensis]KDR55264.1 serine/threonine protein kinase [Arthrospira platensis str. Paraca]MBD2670605.1 tetratricopeptide repeat protein [Arthrospira platensis FACHB-439]MBD2711284.1 tetratricopeptide repeat protein [Arthrospira platensis FACHB-835]MDT9310855.1 tetratricopeptide repeat protein [Limnospira sp. Paracas R14]QQW28580.1 tetratricopeptide repeat protein [Arthrospira sp. PCC 9108]
MSNLPDFQHQGYHTIRQLGCNPEGGRITYLATYAKTNQPVTIKEFRFAFTGASWAGLKAHEREIEMLQQIRHPRIPRYLTSFETPAGFCLVQEYKKAPSLESGQRFTPEQIRQIAISILGILVYLQQHNPPIIHRDIKPGNILVDDRLNAYLVDFGFAKVGGKDTATSSIAAGTPGFMPPEELFNRPLTESSDLYSLGATLICLLTGTQPAHIGQLIDDNYCFQFRHLVKGGDRRFLAWLERLVEPSTKRRFKNASQALAALTSTKNSRDVVISQLKPIGALFFMVLVGNMAMEEARDFSNYKSSKVNRPSENFTASFPWSQAVKLRHKAQSFLGVEQYDKALSAYNMALDINPNYLQALEGRCSALYHLEQYDQALRSCDAAIAINPQSYHSWHQRGNILNQLGRYREALESYNKSIAIHPNYVHSWNGRCWSLNNLHQFQDALKSCDRAIEIDSNSEWVWNNRGYALEKLSHHQEALQSYSRALSINPNNTIIARNYQRALERLHKSAISNHTPTDWFNQGEISRDKGDYEQALSAYDKAIAENSHHFDAHLYRCRVLRILDQMPEALMSCDRALVINSNSHLAWESRAWVLRGLGRYADAIQASDRALAINPRAYWSWIEKSVAWRNLGEYQQALEAAEKAIAINPNQLNGWLDTGIALNHLGRYEQALIALNKALNADPKDREVWHQRGLALEGLNRSEEARDAYNQALILDLNSQQPTENGAIN